MFKAMWTKNAMCPELVSQDVLRCQLCEIPVPPLFCQLCDINLCKTCVGEHLLDESKEHRVVTIKHKWMPTNPMCPKHCDLYCKQCDSPICTLCVSPGDHEQHKKVDILKRKLEVLQSELLELEKSIFPLYQKAASDIQVHKDNLKENSTKLKTIIKKHGEAWHIEIDNIVKTLLSDIDDKKSEQYNVLEEKESIINLRMSEISKYILNLTELVISKNVRLASEYRSRLSEFRQQPPEIREGSLPNFTPKSINKIQLNEMFGFLSTPPKETRQFNALTWYQEMNSKFLKNVFH